jgi:erythromycin esterase
MPTLRTPRLLLLLPLALILAACDGGGGGGGGGVVEPPPVPADTLERLLTDAELATPDDRFAPAENPAWVAWMVANHHPIRSLTSSDFADLQFLKPLLAGRRVVQLGESGHGVRQFNQAKVRLIRFLHEEMGYDVIAFESSLHDCWFANRGLAVLSTDEAMRECMFAVWHTEEVQPLLRYVRESASTPRPLTLAGFDVQPVSRRAAGRARPALLHQVLTVVDPSFAERLRDLDQKQVELNESFNVQAYSEWLRANADSLLRAYGRAEEIMVQNQAALAAHYAADPDRPRVVLATVRGMRAFVRQNIAATPAERYTARDEGMADNLDFLLDQMYPGKKVIVWGHNSHLAKGQVVPGRMNMGGLVHARRGAEVYTVGLYMYTGRAADNGRNVYTIPLPHPAGSLESILHGARRRWTFVDLSAPADGPGTSWMFQPIMSRSWGVNDEVITPRAFYDGVLFVHTTAAPEYLSW